MRRVRALFSLAALLVALPVALRGDDTVTGGLEGTVFTSDGQPVGEALVTASSDRLMGVLTAVTGPRGDYHFYRLPPGTYRLIAKSDAFGEKALADVAVHLGKTTRAEDIVMPPLRATTEIAVEASPPLLDPTSTTIGANITSKEFELLPVGRSYQTIAALVPGVTLDMASYDPVRLRETPSFLGSSAPENAYIVDGLPTTDALWGLNGTQLTFSFIDELEVLTSGYQAEYGHSTGGILKVITKSGGNDFHGDLYSYFNTWGMNGSGLWKSTRGTEIDWIGNQYADFGASLGGALLKDALWFFAAYNPTSDQSKSYGYFGQEMKGTQRSDLYAAKATWNVDSKNRILLSLFGDPKRYEGPWPQSSGNGSQASYQIAEERGANNAVLKYSGVTSGGNLILDFTAGRQAGRMHLDPLSGDTGTPRSIYGWTDPAAHGDPNPLHTNGYEDGAPPFWLKYDPVRSSAELDATYLAGSHEIKAGVSYERIRDSSFETFPAHQWQFFFDDYLQVVRLNAVGDSTTTNTSFFAQDSWQATPRLSVHLGLRYEQQRMEGLTGRIDLGSFSDPSNGWAPRLGVTYDVVGNGKSRLFASWARYYESMPTYVLNVSLGRTKNSAYLNGYGTDGKPFTSDDPPPVVIFDIDTSVNPMRVEPGLKPQYLDEAALGFDWTFSPLWSAGVKGIHRTLGRAIEDSWATVDGHGTLGYPGHGNLSPLPEAWRTYEGLELKVQRAFSKGYQLGASYVYSTLRGNYEGYYTPNAPMVGANMNSQFDYPEFVRDGRLYDDRPHRFKAWGSWAFPFGLSVGSVFAVQSGRPINALGWDPLHGYGDSYVFLEDRGSQGRTPTTWKWDLHLEQRLSVLKAAALTLVLDVFNVTNQNAVVDVDDNKYTQEFDDPANPYTIQNPYWKTPTRYQTPRLVRAGVKVTW